MLLSMDYLFASAQSLGSLCSEYRLAASTVQSPRPVSARRQKICSWTRFTVIPCTQCGKNSFTNNSRQFVITDSSSGIVTTQEEGICLECENNTFAAQNNNSTVFLHLRRCFHLPNDTGRLTANFLRWNDDTSETKRLYLAELPLTRGSVFRSFTLYHNGYDGNISMNENIIDRNVFFIMSPRTNAVYWSYWVDHHTQR